MMGCHSGLGGGSEVGFGADQDLVGAVCCFGVDATVSRPGVFVLECFGFLAGVVE